MIRVLDIIQETTADGPGFRTAIYCAGCENRCPGCHNPESWDSNNGSPMSTEELLEIILDDPFADVTFSGGDPMLQPEGFSRLAQAIKANSKKSIWCYTGYTFEEVMKSPERRRLLQWVDVLVDGRFIMEKKDESLYFRGSSNQRLIDVKESLKKNRAVIYDYDPKK